MNINSKAIVAGAVTGFLGAFLTDLHAWRDAPGAAFDLQKAAKRWIAGAVAGAIGAMGLSGVA